MSLSDLSVLFTGEVRPKLTEPHDSYQSCDEEATGRSWDLYEARLDCGIVCGREEAVRGRRNAAGQRSIMPPPQPSKCRNLKGL
jgi:hypothetical protein